MINGASPSFAYVITYGASISFFKVIMFVCNYLILIMQGKVVVTRATLED